MRESYQKKKKKKKALPDHSGHPGGFWGRKGSHWSIWTRTGKSSDCWEVDGWCWNGQALLSTGMFHAYI